MLKVDYEKIFCIVRTYMRQLPKSISNDNSLESFLSEDIVSYNSFTIGANLRGNQNFFRLRFIAYIRNGFLALKKLYFTPITQN